MVTPEANSGVQPLVPTGRSRRLVWSVLAGVLIICCAGGIALPVVWFAQRTQEAGRGEVSPDAAADVYLGQLSADDEIGVRRVLVSDRRDDLLEQWRTYRADLSRSDPKPSKLEVASLDVVHQGDVAIVTVPVRAQWWQGSTTMQSEPRTWRFEVIEEDGWRIRSVEPAAWCGGYVDATACH